MLIAIAGISIVVVIVMLLFFLRVIGSSGIRKDILEIIKKGTETTRHDIAQRLEDSDVGIDECLANLKSEGFITDLDDYYHITSKGEQELKRLSS